jgi:branched-chain amino acid transport system permease protein
VAVVIILLLPPLLMSDYYRYVATSGAITAIAVLGLGVVTGRAGLISLGQLAFMAIGAFVVSWLQVHAPGVPFLLKLLAGALVAVPVSVLVSVPALRLRGINLGVVTLAFASTISVILTVNNFPGADHGVFVNRPGWLASDSAYYWFSAGAFAAFAGVVALIGRTNLGAGWSAIRESERATAALGRSVPFAKMTAFAVSAFLGGAAGGMLVGQLGIAAPESFAPMGSLSIFALAIMMGARYPEGALLAGALYSFMPEILRQLSLSQDIGDIFFGVGAVIGLRRGFGAAEDLRDVLRRRARRRAGPAAPLRRAEAPPRLHRPERDTGRPALEVEHLSFSYGRVRALEDVSLAVSQGSVLALIGPNGAGKSTLIDCVTGFTRGYEGTISVCGQPLNALPAHRRAHLGVRRSFQQGRTISDLSVEAYVRLGLSRAQRAGITHGVLDDVLAFFSCPPRSTRVGDIDVGTRRLLEVAAAVAAGPAVVLLDEPAAGLAGEESAILAQRIAEVPHRYGSAVLLVEHDIELVTSAAEHVVVIDFGRVIAEGPPAEVLADRTVIGAYLGEEVMV